MHKRKKYIIAAVALGVIMFPKNIYAISSSDYSSRNECKNKYELATANKDYSITHVACYNTYSEAESAMNNNSSNDLIIFDSTNGTTKIVNAKYALLDLSVNKETLTYFYETKDLNTRKYTYMDTGSLYGGVDGALLDVNYGKSVKVKIGGLSAWIANDTYEIVPLNWVKSSSSYTVTDSIRHNYVAKIQEVYKKSAGSTIGPKPEMLSTGTYYSYDGHYFYKDRLTMLKDYKNGNYNNAVNKSNPYYNYYMYLSTHSKTNYSSQNIDEYIRNNMNIKTDIYGDTSQNNSSRLYGQGTYFYYAQEKYGVNAILSLSLSRNESENGRSQIIAITKNNGFGLNAVDSNPSQAANYFPTYASSILEFAYKWVTDGYANPSDSRYFGPVFGDKYIGMNVKYASDTYWSEKMAANYYSFDRAKGMQDYNYYQLGIVNGPTNAYKSPSSMSQTIYKYPEKDDGVLIVDELTNSEGTWYKIQSDKIINGNTITTIGDYNWSSYVYVKKEQVTKINNAKNYQSPSNTTEYKNSKYTYDLFTKDGSLNPKVAVTQSDLDYYYDSTLEEQTGKKVLKDKWIMVYATAYNKNKKPVAYLVTSDYKYDQKAWIKAGSIKFQTTGYGKTKLNTKDYSTLVGQYTWVNSSPHDLKQTVIGGQYNYSYVPLITLTSSDGYTWYKVPVNLSGNDNAYGWTIASFKDQVSFEFTMYYADEDNKNLQIETNNPPTINASNKTIIQGEKFNILENVTATDEEDGNITDKIKVDGQVDTNTPGTYNIIYSVTDSKGEKSELKITITVIKNEMPEIKAEDKIITQGEKFNELKDVTATDKEDGDITDKIKIINSNVDTDKLGEYEITYSVTDSYNQTTTKKIKVTVVKNQIPEIKVSDKTIALNSKFNELEGVTATDKEDGDITDKIKVIKNNVDTTKLGEYQVIYKVVDTYGNEVTKEIKVTVIEKTLEKKDGTFYLNYLIENNNKLQLQGYQTITGIDNNLKNNIEYEIVFENIETGKETTLTAKRITKESDIPKKVYSLDGKDYTYSWFNITIDVNDIPVGNYKMYAVAKSNDFYSKSLINNKSYNKQSTKVKTNNHSAIISNNYDTSASFVEIKIREELLVDKTSSYIYNQYEKYTKFEFNNDNTLHLRGNSYSYGMNLGKNNNVERSIIFEDTKTYKKYTKKLNSITTGNYSVVLPVSDNLSKDMAWYDSNIDISDISKGTYVIYITTKSNITDISEMKEKLSRSLDNVKTTIYNKTYSFEINKSRGNRIEMKVK